MSLALVLALAVSVSRSFSSFLYSGLVKGIPENEKGFLCRVREFDFPL